MANMINFVETRQDGSGKPSLGAQERRVIRSHAMKGMYSVSYAVHPRFMLMMPRNTRCSKASARTKVVEIGARYGDHAQYISDTSMA